MTDLIKKEEDILLQPEVEDISGECPTCTDVVVEPETITSFPVEEPETVVDTPLPVNTLGNCVDTLGNCDYTMGEYLGTLQEAVVNIWKLHLHTRKHFIHVELDTLYHQMLSYVDTLIEQYMGCIEAVLPISDYVNKLFVNESTTELQFLNMLRCFVLGGREKLFASTMTEIWSTIDDIIGALDSTIYKLVAFEENPQPVQTFESFCYEHFSCLNENCDFDDEEEE